MERMRNAIIEEFKKLDHEQKKAVLAFVQKLVDENNGRRVGALRRHKLQERQKCYDIDKDLQ